MFIYISILLFGVLIFLISKLSLGILINSNNKLFAKQDLVDLLIIGWGIFAYFLYVIERFSLPYSLSYLLIAIILFSIILNRKSLIILVFSNIKIRNSSIFALLSLPILISLLSPSLLKGYLFFQNWGPDLDGNLISTGALMNGIQFSDFSSMYKGITNSGYWWLSSRIEPWKFLDLRDGISIEFFLRSMRWGHAVEGKFLNNIFHMPPWFGLQCLILFSGIFTVLQIYKFLVNKNIPLLYSILIPLLLGFSQSTLLMQYEGIQVQYIYTPVFLYLLFNINKIYTHEVRELLPILLGMLLLMISFGEGLQIFITYLILFCFFNYKNVNVKMLVRNLSVLLAVNIFLFTAPLSDFVSWSFIRIVDKMDGGALHYHFSIINVLSSLPYFEIVNKFGHDSIKLFINSEGIKYYIYNIITITVMFIAGCYLFKKSPEKRASILSAAILYFLTLLTKHKYALWKVITITMPVIWVMFCQLIKEKRPLLTISIFGILTLNIIYFFITIEKYSQISEPVSPTQFVVNKNNINGCYAILTPYSKRGYLRLASSGQLNWLNGIPRQFDLTPNFREIINKDCSVVIYYDCSIEGNSFCIANKNKGIKPNFFNLSDKPLMYFLKSDYSPDQIKIDDYLKSVFNY